MQNSGKNNHRGTHVDYVLHGTFYDKNTKRIRVVGGRNRPSKQGCENSNSKVLQQQILINNYYNDA